MDSYPVLRQQSRNKIQNDHSRMQNEFNKMTGDPTSSKYLSVPHPTKRGIENKDPAGAEKAPGRPGISRLPVLAKSLKLQAPTDFTQSHRRWEENPLSGKAKTKKQCTKPVPFNFSHPKAHRMVENQRPAIHPISRAGLQPTLPVNSSTTAHTDPPGIVSATQRLQSKSRVERSPHVTPGQHLAAQKTRPSVLSQSNKGLCNGKKGPLKHQTTSAHISESQPQTFSTNCTVTGAGHPGHCQAPSTFDPTSVGLPTALSGQSKVLNCATASAQPAFTSESCLKHLNMLSLKELPKTLHDNQSLQSATSVQVLSGTAGSGEMFCPDPRAKNGILQNERVSEGGAQGTPQPPGSSQAWNFLPQRVSVMKSRQKNKPSAGPSRAVQFSPDPAALSSILQNEGVKAGGTLGATPCRSVCPSGRTTSIYTAQRVPVTKSRAEAAAGPMGPSRAVQFSPDPAALSSILQNEGVKAGGTLGATPCRSVCPSGRTTSIYTAQRVPVTKSRAEAAAGPMVMALDQTPARKWSPQRVPDTRHHSLSMRKLMSAHRTPRAGPPSLRGLQGHTKDKEEVVQRLFKETDQEQAEEEIRDQDTGADQPPQQTCTTESSQSQPLAGQSRSLEDGEAERSGDVGQPLFQAPHRESVIFFSTGKLLLRSAPEQGTSAAASQQLPSVCPDSPPGPDTPSASLPAGQSNQRRGVVQKAGALSSTAALLRRRLPPFEEMQLDGEVATYAHAPPSSSCSLQRRCGDPVASYLHWQDYTSFVPVIDDPSGPAYSSPSPLWER
ncbi:uncharacterized protein troap isoform X2 [Osmerus eperlanus]|uniref:uncharacterized protein troap isoform X2 n=1 Tax=Osmerus eperlanus TaxID=29151 RepID=UPI002E13155A